MRRALAMALLAAILGLSGCLGLAGGAADQTATPASTSTPTATSTATATPTPTPEPTPSATVIDVDAFASGPPDDWEGMAREAARYWEEEGAAYIEGGAPRFTVSNNPEGEADFRVVFLSEVNSCGYSVTTNEQLGCWEQGRVKVQVCDDREAIVRTLKHELGHQLGLEHGDEPSPLMDAVADSETCG